MATESKEVFKLIVTLLSTLQTEKETVVSSLKEKVSKLENINKTVDEDITSLKRQSAQAQDIGSKVSTLENKLEGVNALKNKEVAKLMSKIDENDQYERRDCIIVSGPDLPLASPSEDSKSIIQKLFKDHLRLAVNQSEISTAHRLGRKPGDNVSDKRPIIVKLCRRDLVRDIFAACKATRPPFYVNCSLTPIRNKILFEIRKLKRTYPQLIKGCHGNHVGEINVFLPNRQTQMRDRKITVNSREEFEEFVQNHVGISVADLNITWPE